MCGPLRLARLAVAASVVVALASCSDEDGKALPGPNTRPPTTKASTVPPIGSGQDGELAKVKACDLLTDDEAATISKGFEIIREGPLGGSSDSCSWSTMSDQVPIEKHVTLGIDVRPQQTVDQVNVSSTGKVTDGKVGDGRKAKQVASENACVLAFAAESGRVDVVISAKGSDRSCDIASDVSTLIEPKLPKPTA